ncbi:MAG: alpha-ketoglutarate-dependent dioxygenase AlkB [Gammaproteobacteria bacterium]|nr:alpha-ketoglutarate-dependent dioxygenase AlkB [Gammaproteobacteria bacterium]
MLQFDLLGSNQAEIIQLKDAELLYWPNLFDDLVFEELMEQIQWQTETIRIAGIERVVPRLTAWYGDKGADYYYSGVRHKPYAWSLQLLVIKEQLKQLIGHSFNSALCNLYRNGQDSVAWHSDDEPELGENPLIASVSLGATRRFELKHKTDKLKHKIDLTSGSLLVMQGTMQQHWLHQIPKEPAVQEPRINITFRTII